MSSGRAPRPRLLPLPAVLALALLGAAGCGEPADTEDGRRAVPEPREEAEATVTPARFRTEVAFAPHGDGPTAYLRLEQVARPGSLARRYRAWLREGSGFRPVLSVSDTLPVPRAGWRPLPAEGLRVVTARDGRLRTLVLERADGALRVTADSTLADWPGRTGQTERLSAARAVRGDDTVPGLLLERRLARPLDTPGPPIDVALLLVAGPGPVGAAVLLETAAGDSLPTATAAHGLAEGGARSWNDVRVGRPPGDSTGWRLELGEGGPVLRVVPSAGSDSAPAVLSGSLRPGEDERTVAGVLVGGSG